MAILDPNQGITDPVIPPDGPISQPNIEYQGPADPVGGGGIVTPTAPTPYTPPDYGTSVPLPSTPTASITPAATPAPIEAGTAEQQQINYLAEFGNTGPSTREVTSNELVATQLDNLLQTDSPFLRNARLRAAEAANARGQFGSSMGAFAAQRAAVEAALPIAQNDAQAYRDAAAQNLSALNQNAIAQLQRVTALETSQLNSNTQIAMANLDAGTRISMANLDAMTKVNIANLDADTRMKITNMTNATNLRLQKMQSDLQLTMQSRNFKHDSAMETLRQEGRVQLAEMDQALQMKLQQAGFTHDFDMAQLNHAQQLEANAIINEYNLDKQDRDFAFQRDQAHTNMAMQAQMNYMNYLSSFAGTDMDSNAASRLQQQADGWLQAQMEMINGLFPEQDPINVDFG